MAKNVAESPLEMNNLAALDKKLAMAKRCSHGNFFFLSLPKNMILVQEYLIFFLGVSLW